MLPSGAISGHSGSGVWVYGYRYRHIKVHVGYAFPLTHGIVWYSMYVIISNMVWIFSSLPPLLYKPVELSTLPYQYALLGGGMGE